MKHSGVFYGRLYRRLQQTCRALGVGKIHYRPRYQCFNLSCLSSERLVDDCWRLVDDLWTTCGRLLGLSFERFWVSLWLKNFPSVYGDDLWRLGDDLWRLGDDLWRLGDDCLVSTWVTTSDDLGTTGDDFSSRSWRREKQKKRSIVKFCRLLQFHLHLYQ